MPNSWVKGEHTDMTDCATRIIKSPGKKILSQIRGLREAE